MFTTKLYYWTSLLTAVIAVGGLTSCRSKPKTPNHQTKTKPSLVRHRQPPASPRHQPKLLTRVKTPTTFNGKTIGIYIGRYHVTADTNERSIRQQVRDYRKQGINTLLPGVWGNGCAMYQSAVTQKLLGQKSCPNQFQAQWIDWTIDEAHKQGMQVHAYFERGIKIDKNSPIYQLAVERRWLVSGMDTTHPGLEQYALDVEHPEVIALFQGIMTEFVQTYPSINAVQWDDFLAYSVALPGANRTAKLTKFATDLYRVTKTANPAVSFDLCHLNPDWSKRTLSADWKSWKLFRGASRKRIGHSCNSIANPPFNRS